MIPTPVYGIAGAVLYLVSGGRWTVVLLLAVLYCLAPGLAPTMEETTTHQKADKLPQFSRSQSSVVHKGEVVALRNIKAASGVKNPANTLPNTLFTPLNPQTVSSLSQTLSSLPKLTKKQAKKLPKVFKALKPTKPAAATSPTLTATNLLDSNIIVFYSSLTGSSQKAAVSLHLYLQTLPGLKNAPRLMNLDDDVDDLDEYFVNTPLLQLPNLIYVMVLPSYDTDSPLDYFLQTLQETATDFRVDKYPLKLLSGYAVLGLGDSESWPSNFCYQAKSTDKWLAKLGARRLFPLGSVCMKTEGEAKISEWVQNFGATLQDDEPIFYEEEDSDSDSDYDNDNSDEGTLVDVEDMGKVMKGSPQDSAKPKEMVAKDSPTYKSLTKQGYTVIGSHSGVKICRWTKSALRGRGSCYKFAFYGIRSHLCMETTPSLSCSNKCVFCWRHGTNPVGTSWRWQVDGPEEILKGALEGHYKKIKQMRGVPGVVADRFNELFTVKHCALSLVGEPIFYPYINEFVGMLHERHISSFLVCNAQHPEQLKNMAKVTQLYVSIDASSKDSLKKVDRPLFKDYWDRLLTCLDTLRTHQRHQRTVFRLTLVKGFNMDDVAGYADMVVRGEPSLIEIKGATFCGSSAGNGNPLTMQNIPFYEECQNFVRNLNKELLSRGYDYGIAAEHAHSCCILMAQQKFRKNGKWYTHIDYDRFFQLLESGEQFDDLDYVSETPSWAYWESPEAGFSPEDTRFNRKQEKLKNKEKRENAEKVKAEKVEEVKVEEVKAEKIEEVLVEEVKIGSEEENIGSQN